MIRTYKKQYEESTYFEKTVLIEVIHRSFKGPRFLQSTEDGWKLASDTTIHAKIGQALRDSVNDGKKAAKKTRQRGGGDSSPVPMTMDAVLSNEAVVDANGAHKRQRVGYV